MVSLLLVHNILCRNGHAIHLCCCMHLPIDRMPGGLVSALFNGSLQLCWDEPVELQRLCTVELTAMTYMQGLVWVRMLHTSQLSLAKVSRGFKIPKLSQASSCRLQPLYNTRLSHRELQALMHHSEIVRNNSLFCR
jgi:hypothetical protein